MRQQQGSRHPRSAHPPAHVCAHFFQRGLREINVMCQAALLLGLAALRAFTPKQQNTGLWYCTRQPGPPDKSTGLPGIQPSAHASTTLARSRPAAQMRVRCHMPTEGAERTKEPQFHSGALLPSVQALPPTFPLHAQACSTSTGLEVRSNNTAR